MPNNPSREAFEAAWLAAHPEQTRREAVAKDGDGLYWYQDTEDAWRWWQAGAAAERQKKITVPDQMQEWKGMDGAIAFHLIERHADGWDDASKMMHEWLEANRDRSAP